MPWDGTELRVAAARGGRDRRTRARHGRPGRVGAAPRVARRPTRCTWSPTRPAGGTSTGWPPAGGAAASRCTRAEEEFAGPLWQLGAAPFALLGDGRLAVLHGLGEAALGRARPGVRRADRHRPARLHGTAATSWSPATTVLTWRAARAPPVGAPRSTRRRRGATMRQPAGPTRRPGLPAGRAPGTASAGQNGRVSMPIVYPPANPDGSPRTASFRRSS